MRPNTRDNILVSLFCLAMVAAIPAYVWAVSLLLHWVPIEGRPWYGIAWVFTAFFAPAVVGWLIGVFVYYLVMKHK